LTTGTAQDSNGNYYVSTDVNGGFNITDDYGCDVGEPVYLVAVGGISTTTVNLAITSATEIGIGIAGNYSYVITLHAANALAVGQSVTFAAGALTGSYGTALNGTTQTVTVATTTNFTIAFGPTADVISGSTTGTAIVPAPINPATVNVAVLGLCPGTSGEFANTLSYVYANEVSTTAAAYALGAFGSGPYDIGASSTNLLGIQNATINAGQLYDIQGSTAGHSARPNTPAGNGIVPQATLDTVANILAACVDSNNTTTVLATESANCNTLFTAATANGVNTGTHPTDTTTAAFNIAHFPAGAGLSSASFMTNLYALQTASTAPFVPNLGTQPNDFTAGIQFPLSLNAYVGGADSIAIDSTGGVWATGDANDILFHLSPVGVLTTSTTQSYVFGSVSVDPSNNAWTGNAVSSTGITEFTTAGVLLSGPTGSGGNGGTGYAGPYTNAQSTVVNPTGGAYILATTPTSTQSSLTTLSAAGNQLGSAISLVASLPAQDDTAHASFDSAGFLWITSESSNLVDRVNPITGVKTSGFTKSTGAGSSPEYPAIDASNNAWIALQGTNGVDEVGSAGGVLQATGGTLSGPYGAAVDGGRHVWITNRTNNSVAEYNDGNRAAISPTTNFTLGGILSDPYNVAIDPSGDLWITNFGGNEIVEMMGPVAPVVTPLSTAAGAGELATLP
jgi:hypothetical protein